MEQIYVCPCLSREDKSLRDCTERSLDTSFNYVLMDQVCRGRRALPALAGHWGRERCHELVGMGGGGWQSELGRIWRVSGENHASGVGSGRLESISRSETLGTLGVAAGPNVRVGGRVLRWVRFRVRIDSAGSDSVWTPSHRTRAAAAPIVLRPECCRFGFQDAPGSTPIEHYFFASAGNESQDTADNERTWNTVSGAVCSESRSL